ncbi:heavy metal translocating P-type ATPase [Acidipropionibacterium jensenii]|uniref:heavy metal translocating P-type ATPase n=1 Tax=Acidipropionibacterium jensenii TaxID=1749 RepID=UPI00214BB085|nr:heavy metal translocating P-type ATPase [Acidipropionibacterium jensenii]
MTGARETCWRQLRRYPLVALVCLTAVADGLLLLAGAATPARWLVTIVCLAIATRMAIGMVADLRSGSYGIDLLAVVAIVSTTVLGEYWAALVICLMVTGGEGLEDLASARAGRSLSALLDNAPHEVGRITEDGTVERIPVGRVAVGDRIQVRPGEMVGVDGDLEVGNATLDESSLTGEPMPVLRRPGEQLMAGSVNGPTAVVMRATALAADSQYQRIVELVRQAQDSRAPFVGLADRVAVPFTAVSLAIAAVAWFLSGDPVRFAEVLVVATPCPLIIAAPVAFMAGTNRAARLGIIIRDSGALEQLARVRTAAFDKTGTLTRGAPRVTAVHCAPGFTAEQVIALAAAVEQMSVHPIGTAITADAADRGLHLAAADEALEVTSAGITARVAGRQVRVGTRSFAGLDSSGSQTPFAPEGTDRATTRVHVWADGGPVGVIEMADSVRPEAAATLAELSRLGIERTLMLTGDAAATAEQVAGQLGIPEAAAGLTPAGKVEAVRSARPRPVMMVGDGVNDAPVLAVAEVGVAMGVQGSAAAVESADVVVMKDDLSRVALAVRIGRRTLSVAWQAIAIGIGLSLALMLVAATGVMPAVVGAGIQELVDLACILWALLSGRPGRDERRHQGFPRGAVPAAAGNVSAGARALPGTHVSPQFASQTGETSHRGVISHPDQHTPAL